MVILVIFMVISVNRRLFRYSVVIPVFGYSGYLVNRRTGAGFDDLPK